MTDNKNLLYNMVHDFISQNPMETGDIIGVLETIKLEFALRSILEVEEQDDEDETDIH